ncbi:hypothetical protein IWGMT90018_12530 [Mycobacterium kiyosense]|nr:hypothetical protein IWGMT90018_12530 [Mycobacterium kiyosense]
MLMAILLRGMDRGEIARWTAAMLASGPRMDFTDLGLPTVDKHSTGGVGDKITLPLVPVVMACGGCGAPGLRARAGPHRRHPGQTGIDPRIHCRAVQHART